jgi:PAS domain S-box-containing protein
MPSHKLSLPAFEQLFRALPGLYLVMTPDLYIVDVTGDYAHAAHRTREQLVGAHIFDAFPNSPTNPDTNAIDELRRSLQYVLEHKQAHEMPIIRYDIEDKNNPSQPIMRRYWKSQNIPILDTEGNVTHILHETREVTENEQLKQEKASNQKHLTLLANAVQAVNWESDLVNNVIHWGYGVSEVFGYTPEAMGSGPESWTLRIHPDDCQQVLQSLEEAKVAGKTNWSAEYRFRKASGTYAFILDEAYITYNSQGEAIRITGSMIDISESKQAEVALKESNARLHQLIDALPYMAWTADANGKVHYFNQNWHKYTGMRSGQTEGWINFLHPEDSAQVLMAWKEALETGYYQIECRVRHQLDGSYRWFLEQAVPIRDEQGRVQLWLGTYTDVDERMQALELLESRDL